MMTDKKSADRRTSAGVVEIGTQLAQALAAQRRHDEVHGVRHSPLADLRYSAIESRLWRWVDSPTDSRIEPVVTGFAASGHEARNSTRESLSLDDFYTLITFARRCALAALRSSDAHQIEPAFVSMAMIDIERIDWRDLIVLHGLVCYVAERCGAPVSDLSRPAIQMAARKTAEALEQQQTMGIDLADTCGLIAVRTPEGAALFSTEYEHFSPEADLMNMAFEIAVALEENGYQIHDISVACELPLVWLEGSDRSTIAKMVGELSGCVSINGVPSSDPAPTSSGQSLLVFIGEAACEIDAREIAAAARNCSNSDWTEIGVSSRKLCAVIVQHSWIQDTPPLEDLRSLERLHCVFESALG